VALKQYDIIAAEFCPKKTDDLQINAKQMIGLIIQWQCAWMIEEGEYAGQWAMIPVHYHSGFSFWVPECDLRRINAG
jgi:hypothetical protein